MRTGWVVTASMVLCAGAASGQEPTRTQVDGIFAFLEGGPGCAVAVVRDGRLLHSAGYGLANLEFQVPITAETVFDFGSASKQFTAAAVFLLAADGLVDLDDPVTDHLPEYPHLTRAVTIRHLIHHTSGIRDYFGLWALSGGDIDDAMPRRAVRELLARQRTLNFEPGTAEMYSNSNYMLLAELVARVSGRPFSAFVAERIFRPLGMTDARVYDNITQLVARRADGYQEVGNGVGRRVLRSTIVGDGGVYGTVGDLAAWAAHFDRNGTPGLGADVLDALLRPGRLADGSEIRYAGGLRRLTYRGLPTVEHGGTMGGYRSYFRRFPEQRFTAVALCNLLELSPSQLTARVADAYLGDGMEPAEDPTPDPYLRSPAPVPAPTTSGAPEGSNLAEFAGFYGTDELLAGTTLRVDGDLLSAQVALTEPTALVHVEGDVFQTPDGLRVVFERGADGAVASVLLYAGRVREIRLFRRP